MWYLRYLGWLGKFDPEAPDSENLLWFYCTILLPYTYLWIHTYIIQHPFQLWKAARPWQFCRLQRLPLHGRCGCRLALFVSPSVRLSVLFFTPCCCDIFSPTTQTASATATPTTIPASRTAGAEVAVAAIPYRTTSSCMQGEQKRYINMYRTRGRRRRRRRRTINLQDLCRSEVNVQCPISGWSDLTPAVCWLCLAAEFLEINGSQRYSREKEAHPQH